MIPSLGRRSRVLLRTALALILAVGAHVSAQEDVPVAPAGEQPVELGEAESGERALEALDAIVDSLETVEKDLKVASDALANKGLPETEKERLEAEIAALNEKKAKLDKDFAAIASGISATDARGVDGTGKLDLGQEFNELLLPIVTELKEATRQPREVEQLRSDLRDAENRYGILSRGLENVDAMMRSAGDSPALLAALEAERSRWETDAKEADGEVKVLRFQLDEVNRRKRSFFDTATEGVQSFFRTRGEESPSHYPYVRPRLPGDSPYSPLLPPHQPVASGGKAPLPHPARRHFPPALQLHRSLCRGRACPLRHR